MHHHNYDDSKLKSYCVMFVLKLFVHCCRKQQVEIFNKYYEEIFKNESYDLIIPRTNELLKEKALIYVNESVVYSDQREIFKPFIQKFSLLKNTELSKEHKSKLNEKYLNLLNQEQKNVKKNKLIILRAIYLIYIKYLYNKPKNKIAQFYICAIFVLHYCRSNKFKNIFKPNEYLTVENQNSFRYTGINTEENYTPTYRIGDNSPIDINIIFNFEVFEQIFVYFRFLLNSMNCKSLSQYFTSMENITRLVNLRDTNQYLFFLLPDPKLIENIMLEINSFRKHKHQLTFYVYYMEEKNIRTIINLYLEMNEKLTDDEVKDRVGYFAYLYFYCYNEYIKKIQQMVKIIYSVDADIDIYGYVDESPKPIRIYRFALLRDEYF